MDPDGPQRGWTLHYALIDIFLENESRPVREAQRRLNPRVWEVVKEEILKWLNAEIIYPISDSQWVSPVAHCSEESQSNGYDEREGRGNPDAPTDEVEGLHRLSEVELCDQEETTSRYRSSTRS